MAGAVTKTPTKTPQRRKPIRSRAPAKTAAAVAKVPAPEPAEAPVAEIEETAAPEIAEAPAGDGGAAEGKTLKRGDLLAAVAARSPMSKSDLRAAMELVLEEIGGALDAGKDLALPPLGKVKLVKSKMAKDGAVLTLRLRRKAAPAED